MNWCKRTDKTKIFPAVLFIASAGVPMVILAGIGFAAPNGFVEDVMFRGFLAPYLTHFGADLTILFLLLGVT